MREENKGNLENRKITFDQIPTKLNQKSIPHIGTVTY